VLAYASEGVAAPARGVAEARREFASFIDGFFAGIQKDWQIPGMVFIAVRDGEVLYKRGYGHTSLDTVTEVSPDKTLFRVGGISKLVTATAIMQLAEKGRLGLDDDVNTYLRRWKLPNAFDEPVTIRSLLTHTGGFDGKQLETCASDASDERNFAAHLTKIMPARYAPPGKYFGCSNMGYALLGSIVERYSRQSFPSAAKRHVFTPLGMSSSTFSPSEEEMSLLAAGYDSERNEVPYAYHWDLPAVSMSSTARDMGRFMLAQLDEGRLGRGRVLSAMYAGSMLRTHFTPHPAIDGSGLGYLERRVGGVRTMQISGRIPGYSSFLMLIPEKRFGLFYAANVSDLSFSGDLANAVVSRFFPTEPPAGAAPLNGSAIPDDVAGYYRTNRISRHTAEKITKFLASQIRVTVRDGALLLTHTRNGHAPAQRWLPVPDGRGEGTTNLFRLVDEYGNLMDKHLFFQRTDDGAIAALVAGEVSETCDKLKWYDAYNRQIALLCAFFAIFGVSALGSLAGAKVNKGKLPWEKGLRAATELWTISTLFCCIQAAFPLGLWIAAHVIGGQFVVFVPYQVKALFVVPLAGGLLLAWFWFRLLGNLLNPDHHWAEKLLLFAVASGEVVYMLYLANWRLLGFMF
jgi:CubicO group peptidase (beta-lactamase class C family)